MTKTTKTALLSQVAELTKTIESLQVVPAPTHLTLNRNIEVPVHGGYHPLDLNYMDEIRAVLRQRVAKELADELIRSGAVKINETMYRDTHRYSDYIRLEASVKVAA